jgi:hypothetical protein
MHCCGCCRVGRGRRAAPLPRLRPCVARLRANPRLRAQRIVHPRGGRCERVLGVAQGHLLWSVPASVQRRGRAGSPASPTLQAVPIRVLPGTAAIYGRATTTTQYDARPKGDSLLPPSEPARAESGDLSTARRVRSVRQSPARCSGMHPERPGEVAASIGA